MGIQRHLILFTALIISAPVYSAKVFHKSPFDYLFGNHIDTHQETKLQADGMLSGFFYVIDTGNTDPNSGLPVMRHPRGAGDDEECGVDVNCIKGWKLEAIVAQAVFLFHSGVNGNDHPVWLVNRVAIPQPGHYTHFHWISADATDDRATAVSDACDKNNAGQLEDQAPVAVNQSCHGWFLQITALQDFAFEHGGEIIPVYEGDDNATHLNLLTNYQSVDGISPTR